MASGASNKHERVLNVFGDWEHTADDLMANVGRSVRLRQGVCVPRFRVDIDQQSPIVDLPRLIACDLQRSAVSLGPWTSSGRRVNERTEVPRFFVRLARLVSEQRGPDDNITRRRSTAIFEQVMD